MKAELTITLEADVLEQARAYARRTGQELNALLGAYAEQLAHQSQPLPALPPKIEALRGSVSLPPEADYKAVMAEELAKKYGV